MTTRSWIRHLFARPVIRPLRKRSPRARPALEALEDRTVPAPIVVNNPTDTALAGKTDLRQAITLANATVGPATITFDATVFATPQTITLSGTQLELTNKTGTETITGPAAGVTVSGGGLSRVFQVDNLVAASISGLTISGGNSASNGGGVNNYGSLTLTNCTVSGNSVSAYFPNGFGGGVQNSGALTLTNCTVSGNSANYGAGLNNTGSLALTNCTVSGNSAGFAGGIYNRNYYGGTATLTNTIVAGNGSSDFVGSFSGNNNLIGGNPLLAPLGNYGGPTQTMALLPGSPAIDAGTSGPGIPSTDQRGSPRVGAVDIGAFESQGFTLTLVAGSTPQTSPIGTPFANPLAVTVTANNPVEPVNGGVVSFVANRVAGATAILSPPPAVISGGQAAVAAEPNNAVGSYTVVASIAGSSPVTFALTNAGTVIPSLVVNTTSGSLFPGTGLLSLPEAVAFANLDSAGISAISFNATVFATPQTITLTGMQLELSNTSETETITGPAAGVTVSGNNASRVFQIDGGVTASLSGLTITRGQAAQGGGLLNAGGTATLTGCTVSGNTRGGGLANIASGKVTLTNSTVSGNTGTGVFNTGTMALTNCTISGNTGDGLFTSAGTATLTNCTANGNFIGILKFPSATVSIVNTIVAANRLRDVTGVFASQGHNLIGSITFSSGWVASDLTGTSAQPLNAVLAPLGNYGGPTQTVALLPGSPAINAGSSGAGIPATDQRGLGRVGAVDIGAFESQGFTGLTLVAGSTPQTANIGTEFARPLAVTVTANNPVEPVNGGVVTFVAQRAVNGATAILFGAPAIIAGGQAAVTAAPNNMDGSYTVTASANGTLPATFALTNTGPVFASLVVNTTSAALFPGAGLLSLPEAVLFANADSVGNSNITFDKTVFKTPQTITLTGTQLELSNTSETETITGPKAGVTVSGGGLSRVFQVDAGVTASFAGLTLSGGTTNGNGGGLLNNGMATLTGCTVSGDSASSGGGLFNSGTLALTNCTISGNTATGYFGSGGGVFNSGTLTLTGCTISGNSGPHYGHGAGLYNTGTAATATLTNCTVSGNAAPYGGGLWNSGTLALSGCTVSGNSTNFGGALDNFASATFTNCTISGNSARINGGGLDNLEFATATLTNCTISGNSTAGNGGGLDNYLYATATLTGCTVSGNSAAGNGGGLNTYFSGTATLTNCTVSGNAATNGGGLNNGYGGTTTVTGSNVKNNSAAVGGGMANQGTLSVASSNIINNTATSKGGGLSTTGGSATLTDCVINTNQVTSTGTALGGGIDCENSTLSLTNCTVNANQANGVTAKGGGLYALNSTVTVKNSTVNGNKANGSTLGEGGGIYSSSTALTLLASNVKGNKASTDFDDLFNGP